MSVSIRRNYIFLMLHPEDVQVKAGRPGNVKTERKVEDFAEHAGKDRCRQEEPVLFEEVDKLRRKVYKLESDNSSLRASLAEKRRLEEESKDIRKQAERWGIVLSKKIRYNFV